MRKFWHKWPLALVMYTDENLRPPVVGADGTIWRTAGTARGAVVRIHPDYEADTGILHHELNHVCSFWELMAAGAAVGLGFTGVCLLVFGGGFYLAFVWIAALAAVLLMRKMKAYKVRCEAMAYAAQLKHHQRNGLPSELASLAARLASPVYDFGLTQVEAERLILKYV